MSDGREIGEINARPDGASDPARQNGSFLGAGGVNHADRRSGPRRHLLWCERPGCRRAFVWVPGHGIQPRLCEYDRTHRYQYLTTRGAERRRRWNLPLEELLARTPPPTRCLPPYGHPCEVCGEPVTKYHPLHRAERPDRSETTVMRASPGQCAPFTWVSAVAAVSKRGENADSFRDALSLHANGGKNGQETVRPSMSGLNPGGPQSKQGTGRRKRGQGQDPGRSPRSARNRPRIQI